MMMTMKKKTTTEVRRGSSMAANDSAAKLHWETPNKIAATLAYAVLEWILIGFLLLDSLISSFVARFASFFGLDPPCVLCSRLAAHSPADPGGGDGGGGYRDLFCDRHAAVVSGLAFCHAHRRLADAGEMCEDCSAGGGDRTAALISWMKRSEGGERDLRCSCCDSSLESCFYSPYLLAKPSRGGRRDQKGESVGGDKAVDAKLISSVPENVVCDWAAAKEAPTSIIQSPEELLVLVDSSLHKLELVDSMAVTVFSDSSGDDEDAGCSVELPQSASIAAVNAPEEEEEEDKEKKEEVEEEDDEKEEEEEEDEEAIVSSVAPEASRECSAATIPALECQNRSSEDTIRGIEKGYFFEGNDFGELQDIEIGSFSLTESLGEAQALEEDFRAIDFEGNCEVSIGSEICEPERINRGGDLDEPTLLMPGAQGPSEQNLDEEAIDKDLAANAAENLHVLLEANEDDEDRAVETPTYIERTHALLHKRFMFEKRDSGTGSIDDGSFSGYGEPLTVEHLRSALESERMAMNALYAELEEERSAAAIAANQTMAMITRLQEEKATVRMEALQYQRMMEEQSEYDQEALQLLNDLMTKREKEKQELENELELYRNKVRLYEATERRKIKKSNANATSEGASSASLSAEEEIGDLSVEYNEGEELLGDPDVDHGVPENLETLNETLAEFEEGRFSILEQLKVLEEKLFVMDDEHLHGVEAVGGFSEESGHGVDACDDYPFIVHNGHVNGFLSDGFITDEKSLVGYRSLSHKGKRLLPLFNAVASENGHGMLEEEEEEEEQGDAPPEKSISNLTLMQKKLAIAEEIDDVYERLQDLETDREFLEHCIGSLKEGDKGMDLLQEILVHLNELRSVEIRVRNAGEALASLSS